MKNVLKKAAAKVFLAALAGLAAAGAATAANKDDAKTVPPGTPVTITVQTASSAPDVSLKLNGRCAKAVPCRDGCNHTGGGNIDVQQPSPDTIVITMTGGAVAYGSPKGAGHAGMDFDLEQCFEVSFDNPEVKAAKISIEGRVMGVLRSHCKGGQAEESGACASILCGPQELLAIHVPAHSVAGGENLSVNDHEGPCFAPVAPGKYKLHQTFHIAATAPKCLLPCKAPSVEFADGAIDPIWISYKEPFHGVAKKDFGFQVTIKVEKVEVKEPEKPAEPVAAPAK